MQKAVDLEKENAELKTRNKAQEESLEFYFLNNEKNEKCIADLEKENAELKKQQFSLRNERNTFLAQNEQYEKDLIDFNENLTEAKKIIKKIENIFYSGENALKRLSQISDTLKEAEDGWKSKDLGYKLCADERSYKTGFQDGYNKANEWHNLRKNPNDLPTDTNVMSVSSFATPHCNYCSLQKDCKIKLDKEFNSKLFEALKDVTLPKGIRIELNCAHFSPNKDAFKMLIKENGDIECLGLNEDSKL